MNPSLLATNIVPLADFKSRAAEILNGLREDRHSVVITQNGKAAAVLVSPQEYDSLVERSQFIEAVEQGLDDVKMGRMVEQNELAAEITARYRT